jgi:urease accessory protein
LIMPLSDLGVAASVVVLGAALALQLNFRLAIAMAFVGFFALFHGYVHGAEMHSDWAGWRYAFGFLTATALLHMFGLGVGLYLSRQEKAIATRFLQAGGGLMAAVGIAFLVNSFG